MGLAAVLGTLFLYSVAMFTLPFAAFFGTEHIMKTEFHTDRFTTNCFSAAASVIVVYGIIACYAYQAMCETDDEPKESLVHGVSSDELTRPKSD